MLPFASALDVDPWTLVRVLDPDYPGAEARSETASVLLEPPPPGIPWRHEIVPEVDAYDDPALLDALNAVDWHGRGVDGTGVSVAVFDLQWYGAEVDPDVLGDVETHDCWAHHSCLPPMDTLRPRFSYEQGVHGVACAEVVRQIAPGAELHLVRVNGQSTLENAVDWAIREQIDVVSMSLSYFNASFYDGTGNVSAQADKLRAHGVVLVTSAGNYARGHWQGRYHDGDGDGRMDFDGENALEIDLVAGAARAISLTWDQFDDCGITDLDATLYDPDGRIVSRSRRIQDADADECEPFERVSAVPEEDGVFRLEVRVVRGAVSALDIDVLTTAGRMVVPHPAGSIADPGSSRGALTVGAIDVTGYLENNVEGFSSQGPTSDGRDKPDIGGPDGLSTQTYGARGFYGTSASTPAVAGTLALLLSEDPELTPLEGAERLQGWAFAQGDPDGHDDRWGAGKARLPVEIADSLPCGSRPLALGLVLLPLSWLRRRRVTIR